MNTSTFNEHTQRCLGSVPSSAKDTNLPLDERKLEALIHLNTSIHPQLKGNTGMLLEILQMKDGPEKLRLAMLWHIAVSQTSPEDMREIIKLMDEYLKEAVSWTHVRQPASETKNEAGSWPRKELGREGKERRGAWFLENAPNTGCSGGRPTEASIIPNITGRPH